MSGQLCRLRFWDVKVISDMALSDADRDLIIELTCHVAQKGHVEGATILHDVVESKKYCQLLIEANKASLNRLLMEIEDFFQMRCVFKPLEFSK